MPVLAVIAALGVAAAVAGFVLGGSGSSSESDGAELANSASAGSLGLSFPSGWKRIAGEPGVAGMSFSQPIVLSPAEFPGARLVAGQVEGTGPTLLPRDFLARLPDEPSRDDAVRLGELQAFRYPGLTPRGTTERVTIYAAPTTEGVATVACLGGPRAAAGFGQECERVAATLELTGGKPLPLGPRREYANAAGSALRRLDRSAAAARRRMRTARTPAAQSAAAASLAGAYRRAARSLSAAEVGPFERAANARLVTSLRRVGAAYARAGSAARRGNRGGYAAAGRSVRRAGAGLRRALAGLAALGYAVK
jgi:hypothetical protein